MTDKSNVIIQADGVDLRYGSSSNTNMVAVSGLNFEVRRGTFHTLVGPSGCGKSTILKAIAGLVPPFQGSLFVGTDGACRLEDISMTFQAPTLLPWLTVRQNALLPYKITGQEITNAVMERLALCLELVGLTEYADSLPRELSGGMAMRAALVRAFIPESKLILLDEPFASLDEWTRARLIIELENLWKMTGSTVVFVTHNIDEAVMLSDEISLLSNSPGTILKNFTIPLPRPRAQIDRRNTEYIQLIEDVRDSLVRISTNSVELDEVM